MTRLMSASNKVTTLLLLTFIFKLQHHHIFSSNNNPYYILLKRGQKMICMEKTTARTINSKQKKIEALTTVKMCKKINE